ncbi:MAG: hypothetical protein FWG98_00870 [Candidatus Cloacimonetes bacterium]|nr:hypothetical protein [Candidatus Cloacimonadota bacterium]
MKPENDVLDEIISFFSNVFENKINTKNISYAEYKTSWLKELNLDVNCREETKVKQTIKKLQEHLKVQFGERRIKTEAKVAENMELRFKDNEENIDFNFDSSKLMAFDILDLFTGTAFEISLSDAFAEFFKDLLKALLDSRIKKLYLCMKNHSYNTKGGSSSIAKSGYNKVVNSPMIRQYVQLAKLYKIEVNFINIFPDD